MLRPVSFLAIFILTAASGWAQPNAADESAIREVVKKYVEAREQRDPKAVEALFTEDADQLVSSGEWRKGREALVKGTLESSTRNSGRRTIQIESVRFLSRDIALADGPYEISGNAGAEARRMWTSFVMVRGPKGFRIAAIRNMLPAPQR